MKLTIAALALALLMGGNSANVYADTEIAAEPTAAPTKSDKRKTQINKRLNKHNKKIRAGIKKGTITQNEGNALAHKDKAVRDEKNDMEERNDGELTKKDQKHLNKHLNDSGDAIGHEVNDTEHVKGESSTKK